MHDLLVHEKGAVLLWWLIQKWGYFREAFFWGGCTTYFFEWCVYVLVFWANFHIFYINLKKQTMLISVQYIGHLGIHPKCYCRENPPCFPPKQPVVSLTKKVHFFVLKLLHVYGPGSKLFGYHLVTNYIRIVRGQVHSVFETLCEAVLSVPGIFPCFVRVCHRQSQMWLTPSMYQNCHSRFIPLVHEPLICFFQVDTENSFVRYGVHNCV